MSFLSFLLIRAFRNRKFMSSQMADKAEAFRRNPGGSFILSPYFAAG